VNPTSATSDIQEHGACVLKGVLTRQEVSKIRSRLVSLCDAGGDVIDPEHSVPEISHAQSAPALRQLVGATCGLEAARRLSLAKVVRQGATELSLHADLTVWMVPRFNAGAEMVCSSLVLDHFGPTFGAPGFVFGSHKLRREPQDHEVSACSLDFVEAEPGDVVVWLGATWHARPSRTLPGERVTVITCFANHAVPANQRTV
jgi:Phytanoyl-CoA dioxygenase (PhyH)